MLLTLRQAHRERAGINPRAETVGGADHVTIYLDLLRGWRNYGHCAARLVIDRAVRRPGRAAHESLSNHFSEEASPTENSTARIDYRDIELPVVDNGVREQR